MKFDKRDPWSFGSSSRVCHSNIYSKSRLSVLNRYCSVSQTVQCDLVVSDSLEGHLFKSCGQQIDFIIGLLSRTLDPNFSRACTALFSELYVILDETIRYINVIA